MRLDARKPPPPGENVVPLINIVFLLLMFFLLAGTLTPPAPADVEPVETERGPPADAPADALYVSAQGTLYVRGVRTDIAGLEAALARAGLTDAETSPQVVLDRRLTADRLFPVVEALSRSGVGAARLVTRRREAP